MAIAPNTNPFVSGAVLTAAQMTALPMGVYSFAERTTSLTPISTETVVLTLPSFTAVANRYYRVTGFLPYCETTGGGTTSFQVRIRKGTTTGGTQLQLAYGYAAASANSDFFMAIQWVGTLTAGAQQMVLTFESGASATVLASAVIVPQFVIEDIGGA
jgi:hypothetical protein